MTTVPDRLIGASYITPCLQTQNYCVLSKQLSSAMHGRESYVRMHVLSIISQGRQAISREDGSQVTVRDGQAILLPRGLYTISDLIPKGNFEATLIFFRTPPPSDSEIVPLRSPPCTPFPWAVAKTEWQDETAINEYLTSVPGIGQLDHGRSRRDPVAFLERHYDKGMTLEDLAFMTGMSVSTFQRTFKKRVGQSPRNWIIQRRMHEARKLLERPGVTVAEAATTVGYCNTSHFIAQYRKTYGRTPLTEYRHFQTG